MMRNLPLTLMLAAAFLAAGCADQEPETDDVDIPDVDEPQVVMTHFNGSVMGSAGTPHVSFNYGGDYVTELPRTANVTTYRLQLEWDATATGSEELALWIRDAEAGAVGDPESYTSPAAPVGSAEGVSPLVLDLDAADLEDIQYNVMVRAPSMAGLVADQPFHLTITQFEGDVEELDADLEDHEDHE